MPEKKINTSAVIEHLRVKWQGKACQQCGTGNWQVQDKAYELRQFHGGTLVTGGSVIPLVPVICSNCGNTLLVNAIISGAVNIEKPQEEGGKP